MAQRPVWRSSMVLSTRLKQGAAATAAVLSVGLLLWAAVVLGGIRSPQDAVDFVKDIYRLVVPDPLRPYVWAAERLLLNPLLYAVIAAVFVFEWLRPANRQQKLLSRGFVQDVFWFVGDGILWIGALAFVGEALRAFYDAYLSFLTIGSLLHAPQAVRIVIAILFIDFLDWGRHYLKHRVWWLWAFHAVHHSQTEMNLFTDFRVHVLERVINNIFVFIPLFMFQVAMPTDYYIALGLGWYRMIYHANIRTSYGLLKYVMVTPQFHRVHHSRESAHLDVNFGVTFTFWDRLFGTHWSDYDQYPQTGIEDGRFPFEQHAGNGSIIRNWLAQTSYPFVVLSSRVRAATQSRAARIEATSEEVASGEPISVSSI